MKRLLAAVLVGCIALTGSSLVSMIGVFIGSTNPHLQTLLAAQAMALYPAALVFVLAMGVFVLAFGFLAAWRQVWIRLPGWLLFAFVSVNSLVLAGELSYLLIHGLTERVTHAADHVPLMSGLLGSLACCAVYALTAWKR